MRGRMRRGMRRRPPSRADRSAGAPGSAGGEHKEPLVSRPRATCAGGRSTFVFTPGLRAAVTLHRLKLPPVQTTTTKTVRMDLSPLRKKKKPLSALEGSALLGGGRTMRENPTSAAGVTGKAHLETGAARGSPRKKCSPPQAAPTSRGQEVQGRQTRSPGRGITTVQLRCIRQR